MWRRILAGVLALLNGVNGLVMLGAPSAWFAHVPGAADTGPFNAHLVEDVGLAFLIAALGIAAFAWRTRFWPAALAGSGFLGLHALMHVWGIAQGLSHTAAIDLAGIVAPAALALLVSWPRKGEIRA